MTESTENVHGSGTPDGVDRLLWRLLTVALDRPCKNEHTIHKDTPSVYLHRYWLNCDGVTYAEQSFNFSSSTPDDAAMWAKEAARQHVEGMRLRAVYDAVTQWLAIGEGVTS